MKESIPEFIRRKKEFLEQKEVNGLRIFDNLITVDGVDGSGKDTISDLLVEKLKKQHGAENVVKIDATHFLDEKGNITSLGQRVHGADDQAGLFSQREHLKNRGKDSHAENKDQQIDRVFIAAVNRAYTDKVIPALDQGKIVVIPRSELNLLRYALQESNQRKISREKEYLLDGTTTGGVLAGNRVFIEVAPGDAIINIKESGTSTFLDPQDVLEVEASIEAQHEAEKFITEMVPDEVNVVRIQNARVEGDKLDAHLDRLCEEIISVLRIVK